MLYFLLLLILQTNLPILSPIQKADFKYVSSPFGWRKHPIQGHWHFHKGIDIAPNKPKAKVFATANGTIQKIQFDSSSGLSILIQHKSSFKTRYAHLSKILVQENQKVKAGQVIGIIGNTGQSTGEHLHYEVWLENVAIDPVQMQGIRY